MAPYRLFYSFLFMEKPELDRKQLEYLHDTSFLLAKRKISKQLDQLLAATERVLVGFVQDESPEVIPESCLTAAGKISRGENYRGLPYLVLDYPRLFKKEDIFTFRTMCWWGHFFSSTLHLQGTTLDLHRRKIEQSLLALRNAWPETYLCVHKTPWEYHYGEDNYQLLQHLDEGSISNLLKKDFIKISRKTALDNYQELPEFTLQAFRDFLSLLKP